MISIRTRGKKGDAHLDPNDPPRCRANKQPGHGTYDNDRPPIIHIISRETGEERCWVAGHSDKATCQGILAEAVPSDGTIVYSDEECSYHGIEPQHATVNHGEHEWARDDDGDGVREVHCNSCEGQAQRCARSCDRFAACIKPISNSTSRPTKRSSMPSASHRA